MRGFSLPGNYGKAEKKESFPRKSFARIRKGRWQSGWWICDKLLSDSYIDLSLFSNSRIAKKATTRSRSFECETYQYGGIEPQRIFFSENGNHSFLHDVYDVHAESRSLQQDVDLIMRPELVEFGVFPHAVRLVFGTPHRIDACILLGVGVPMLIKDRESVIRKQTPGCRPMKLTWRTWRS